MIKKDFFHLKKITKINYLDLKAKKMICTQPLF